MSIVQPQGLQSASTCRSAPVHTVIPVKNGRHQADGGRSHESNRAHHRALSFLCFCFAFQPSLYFPVVHMLGGFTLGSLSDKLWSRVSSLRPHRYSLLRKLLSTTAKLTLPSQDITVVSPTATITTGFRQQLSTKTHLGDLAHGVARSGTAISNHVPQGTRGRHCLGTVPLACCSNTTK